MKYGRWTRKIVIALCLFSFVAGVGLIMAEPLHQGFPCFGGEGCPEPVDPEPDEYYAVQCTTNAVWIWVSVPGPSLVTFVSLFQIDALSDGASLIASNNVTVTRSGDTITLSGENGNFAPQPGEKSFSWSECVRRNDGLPELPPIGRELTDAEIECMNLPTEQEKSDCLNSLTSQSGIVAAQTCEDEVYSVTHWQECQLNCRTIVSVIVNRGECYGNAAAYEIWEFWRNYCFGPIQASAIVGTVVAFRRRRKRRDIR